MALGSLRPGCGPLSSTASWLGASRAARNALVLCCLAAVEPPVAERDCWRPTIDDVDRISWGRNAKQKGTGSRGVPHRLNEEERVLYDAARAKGFVEIAGSGWRRERSASPLVNTYRSWCDARGVPAIYLHKSRDGSDEVVVDLAPLRTPPFFEAAATFCLTNVPDAADGVIEAEQWAVGMGGDEDGRPAYGNSVDGAEGQFRLAELAEAYLRDPIYRLPMYAIAWRRPRSEAKALAKGLAVALQTAEQKTGQVAKGRKKDRGAPNIKPALSGGSPPALPSHATRGMRPLLASAADDGIALWGEGSEPSLRFAPHSASISALQWTANDRVLASGSLDGSIVLSEPDGALFDTLRPVPPAARSGPVQPIPVLALTWSPASRYLASGSADALVRIFDLQKREHALTLRGQRSGVCALSWSPSEVHVASASALGDVLVHRVQGSVSAVCRAPAAAGCAVRGVHWSPFHPSKLAAASDDGVVSLWDMTPSRDPAAPTKLPIGTLLHKFCSHTAACCGVAWSKVNHHLLVSAAADGQVLFYDSTRHAVVRTIVADSSPITSLTFAPDGLHIACGTSEGQIRVYDLRSLSDEPLWVRAAHEAPITALAFQKQLGGGGPGEAPATSTSGSSDRAAPELTADENVSTRSPVMAASATVSTSTSANADQFRGPSPSVARHLPSEPDYSSQAFASPIAERHPTCNAVHAVAPVNCDNDGPPRADCTAQDNKEGGGAKIAVPAASATEAAPSAAGTSGVEDASASDTDLVTDVATPKVAEHRAAPLPPTSSCRSRTSVSLRTGTPDVGRGWDGARAPHDSTPISSRDGSTGTVGGGRGVLSTAALAAIDGAMLELRATLREEMRAMQVELIRGLESQRHEVRQMLVEGREEIARLREDNAALREENARLRAPLGVLGLGRWEGVS